MIVRCCTTDHHCQDLDRKRHQYHHRQCLPVRSLIFLDSCLVCNSLLCNAIVHRGIGLSRYRDRKFDHFQPIQFCRHTDTDQWTLPDNTHYCRIAYHPDTRPDYVLVYKPVVARRSNSPVYMMSYTCSYPTTMIVKCVVLVSVLVSTCVLTHCEFGGQMRES